MTDREKLIDIIEYYADFLDWDRKEDMVDSIMEKGFATDNNVGDKMTPTWIPVTERLPEENTAVLAYRKSGFNVESRGHKYWDNDGFSTWSVTHWMPLPEPPKGE